MYCDVRVHTQSLRSCPALRFNQLSPARLLCLWGFSRQEYWSGLPLPSPEDFPDPQIEPASPASQALQADSLSLRHL